jgi:ribosomal protein S18 acetylase RimI-like enzyme
VSAPAPPVITLRPAAPDDLGWLEALAASPAVEPSLATGAAAGLAPALDAGELLVATMHDGDVGALRIIITNRRSRIAAIRTLMVDPEQRGRGIGLAIVHAATRHLVDTLAIHRVEAEVYGFNDAGLRLFDAAGYAREGTRRRAYDRHGDWQDGVLYAYLADEPAG